MKKKYIVLAVLSIISVPVFAEDKCSDVLIAAVERQSDNSYRKVNTELLDAMCSEEMRHEIRSSGGSGGFNLLNLVEVSGGGEYSNESSFVNQRCSNYSKKLSLDEARSLLVQSTSQQVVQAWQACIEKDNVVINPLTCKVKSVNYKDKIVQINIRYLANHGPAVNIEYSVENGDVIGGFKNSFKPSSFYKKQFVIEDTSQPMTFEIHGDAKYSDPNCSITIPSQPPSALIKRRGSNICEFRRQQAKNDREITYGEYLALKEIDYVPLTLSKSLGYAPRVSCSEYKTWY
jgi:hypothetical protein